MSKWIVFLLLIISGSLSISWNSSNYPQSSILDHFIKNPENSAIKLIHNDSTIAEHNGDKMMPLASTVKLIIAIEFAHQAASSQIDPTERISIDSLDHYFIPFTDGGAHPAWLKYSEEVIIDNKISLLEVAKGMIIFSSNANTEFLLDKLGIQNINNRIKKLELTNHDDLNYIVSALLLPNHSFPKLSENMEIADSIRALSTEDYLDSCHEIHQLLKKSSTYKSKISNLSIPVQEVWSDRLPASTVNTYAELMHKISSRSFFSESVYKHLDELIAYLLENSTNQTWIEHCGDKGGSTTKVLTRALYVNTIEGNRTSLSYFFNNLSLMENMELQQDINSFELEILTNPDFRTEVEKVISNLK